MFVVDSELLSLLVWDIIGVYVCMCVCVCLCVCVTCWYNMHQMVGCLQWNTGDMGIGE